MNLRIFDSHAHYDDDAFDADRDALLESLPSYGIAGVVDPGCSVSSSLAAIRLAERYPFVYAAVGIHPEEAADMAENALEAIARAASHPKAVAIGEIGLDYHYSEPSRERQRECFERQLALACELNLPVIVHDRDAHADTMELLKKYRPHGVMHCFSGSAKMAAELVRMGFYLGFTGVITFKNAKKPARAVEAIPLQRILIETDCPYMAPEPFRGKRCDSTMLSRMLAKIAEIKGIRPEEAAPRIFQNTLDVFGIRL